MTKAEAERECLRQWRALPIKQRQSVEQARQYAETLWPVLQFRTMGDPKTLITSWLIRDLLHANQIKLRS